MVPIDEPGGGLYTVMIHSLASLWEDFEHLNNIWTQSNAGLPLCRYMGVDLYFYQSVFNDYCVEIEHCLPMVDTKYTHADIAPNRMMLKKNTIKVPSLETKRKRKPYKKVRVPPPAQLQNKWYFQQDLCNIPLVMIKATACDFRYPFGKSDWQSNNITIKCLNPALFHRRDWGQPSTTTGYFPKPSLYLYAPKGSITHPTKKDDVIYLGNTLENKPGKDANTTFADWGNPFWHHYLDGSIPIYTAQNPPSQLPNETTFTELTTPMILTFRYNPDRDTGKNNQIYLLENYHGDYWEPPGNPNLILSGFPLFDIIFGYLDWQEKVHEVQNIDEHQIFTIKSDWMNEKCTAYIPLNESFLQGFGPYNTNPPSDFHNSHWHPKVAFQKEIMNTIALTGPACPRPPYNNYSQAKFRYKFKFKWGGCPKQLEKPYDPCSQPRWNIPSNINEGLQIQNPNTNPQTEIQEFDWRRDYVKQKTIERIKQYTPTDETLQIFTDSRSNAPILRQTSPESSDSEETQKKEKTLQEQISELQQYQRKLKHRLLHRMKLQSLE